MTNTNIVSTIISTNAGGRPVLLEISSRSWISFLVKVIDSYCQLIASLSTLCIKLKDRNVCFKA